MKILLVNLKTEDERDNRFPLGLSYIASALNEYNVEIYDLNFQDDFAKKITDNKIDIVGFSCYTGMLFQASRLAQEVKLLSPSTLCVIGGYHATVEYEYILKNYIEFDIAIIGRGERPFIEIARALSLGIPINKIKSISLRNENGEIRSNIDSLPTFNDSYIPERKCERKYFLNESKEKLSCISTMRGCYFNCSFCSIHSTDYISICSYEEIKEDVKTIVLNGSNALYFTNPDFLSNSTCVENTLRVLYEFPQIKTFKISTRSDSIIKNKKLLKKLFERGCNSIELGVESFSNSQLKRYNKGINAERNIESYCILREYGEVFDFKSVHELIPFDPWVTRQELSETIEFYVKNPFDYLELEPWLFTRLILYPNTALRNRAEHEMLIASNSHIEIPYCNFVHKDISNLFATFYKYKCTVLPTVIELRDSIIELLQSLIVSSLDKIILVKIKENLEKCTLLCLADLVSSNPAEYDEIVKHISIQVLSYKEKIIKIKNKESKE